MNGNENKQEYCPICDKLIDGDINCHHCLDEDLNKIYSQDGEKNKAIEKDRTYDDKLNEFYEFYDSDNYNNIDEEEK